MTEPQFGEHVPQVPVTSGWNRVALASAVLLGAAVLCLVAVWVLAFTGRFGVVALAGDAALGLAPAAVIVAVAAVFPRWQRLRGLWVAWLVMLLGCALTVYVWVLLSPILIFGPLFARS